MSNIKIVMKNGDVRVFKHEGRSGGSYTKTVKFEGAFVIITDEYNKRIAIPANDVQEVIEDPHNYYW